MYNCSCLAKDLWKTFSTYWDVGYPNATIPFPWPLNYSTHINNRRPLEVEFNGILTETYFSVSTFENNVTDCKLRLRIEQKSFFSSPPQLLVDNNLFLRFLWNYPKNREKPSISCQIVWQEQCAGLF